jgi:acyl-[acyl-carrier-protein]-phospholipid O-acyltransferase / long-chain-fatty-acid--[acyl-carrier-protein] ligase
LAPLLYFLQDDIHQEAVVLFTSGSEGEPKGVALSHANIQANCQQIRSMIGFSQRDVLFNPLPLFHSFGLTAGMILPLLSGTKVILYPSPLHYHEIPAQIKRAKATILFGTDTFLNGYAHYATYEDLCSLKLVFAGAEKLKRSTYDTWLEKFNISIYEGYGATEAAPVLSLNTPTLHKLSSVGRFLPAIHYRLIKMEGIDVGGRLSVAGPNLMLGYYLSQTPGILKQQHAWHDTGDIAQIDSLGFITLLGRAKRFAKIAGEMISLLAVENYLHELWPSYQHAVITQAHPHRGEILVLVTSFSAATREAIIHYAHAHGINELSIPRRLVVLSELPLLGSGKIDYKRLAELI